MSTSQTYNQDGIESLEDIKYCQYCGRLDVKIKLNFEFFELGTYAKLIRDVKLCDTCKTVHYLEDVSSTYFSIKKDYYIKKYTSYYQGDFSYLRIDAAMNRAKFYRDGSILDLEEEDSTIKEYHKNKSNLNKDNEEADSLIEAYNKSKESKEVKVSKPIIKPAVNYCTVKVAGNLSKFML